MTASIRSRRLLFGPALITLVVSLLSFLPLFQKLEWKTYDLRARWLARGPADADIVIIEIDEASLARLEAAPFQARWPFSRDLYAALIDYLAVAKARAVLFDILFLQADRTAPEKDAALADATRRAGNVYYAAMLQKGASTVEAPRSAAPQAPDWKQPPLDDYNLVALPFAALLGTAKGVGTVQLTPDDDGIFRRAPLFFSYRGRTFPGFATAAALDLLGPALPGGLHPASGEIEIGPAPLPLAPNGRRIIKWYGGPGHFRSYPIGDLIASSRQVAAGETPSIDPAVFGNKIVLIGATAPGLMDRHPTPVASNHPGVEIQATLLQNLLQGEGIRAISPSFQIGILFLLTAITSGSALVGAPRRRFLFLIALVFGYLFTAAGLFRHADVWLPVAAPLAGIFMAPFIERFK